MKKNNMVLGIISGFLLLTGQAIADGSGIEGVLEKIDGNYYVVKDEKGKVHRYPFDEKTRKRGGEIKEGIKVELYVRDDRVSMIEAIR